MKNAWRQITGIFLFGIFIVLCTLCKPQNKKIIFLHVNDIHGHVAHFPRLKYLVDSFNQEHQHVFVLSAGDIFTGNPVVDRAEDPGLPVIKLMNEVGFHLNAMGNHEFDYGQEILTKRMEDAEFDFLCANVISESPLLTQPKGYKFFDVNNQSLGFVSFIQLNEEGHPSTNPEHLDGLQFKDALAYHGLVESIRDSVDLLIGLTHLGFSKDQELAMQMPEFDVIIGGHSHTYIDSFVEINGTPIVQSGAYMDWLGVTVITCNEKDGVVGISSNKIRLHNNAHVDTSMKNELEQLYAQSCFFEKITYNPKPMNKQQLGRLYTSAMINKTGANAAIFNYSGIRLEQLDSGEVTLFDLYSMDPFNNEIKLFKIDSSDFRKKFLSKTKELAIQINGPMKDTVIVAINDYISAQYALQNALSLEKRLFTNDILLDFMAAADPLNIQVQP